MPILTRLGASLLIAAALTTHAAAADHVDGDDLYESCRARGATDAQCHCLTIEAGSRFTADEIAQIARSSNPRQSADERAADLRESGVTPQQLAELTRRLIAAEPVIQNTCGIGLMRAVRD